MGEKGWDGSPRLWAEIKGPPGLSAASQGGWCMDGAMHTRASQAGQHHPIRWHRQRPRTVSSDGREKQRWV